MSLNNSKLTFILFAAINFISSESFTADTSKKTVDLPNMPQVIIFPGDKKIIEIPGNAVVNFAQKMGRDYTKFNATSFLEVSTDSVFNASNNLERLMIVVNAALKKTGQQPVTTQEVISIFSSEKK